MNRILSLFALVISIAIFFAYVNPTWHGSIAETKVKIVDYDKALVAVKDYNKQQQVLASARNAITEENLKKLEVFLPDSVDNVALILDLDAIASRFGLKISNLDVATERVNTSAQGALSTATNPVGAINLSLSVTGSYTAFQSFLQSIEKNTRILDVQDITVKGSDTGVYTYQLKMRLYWLR